jgi:hypothetical protein
MVFWIMAHCNLVDGSNNPDEYAVSIFIIKYLKTGAIFTSKDLDSTYPNKVTEGCLKLKYKNMYIWTLKASQTHKSAEVLGLVFKYCHEWFFYFFIISYFLRVNRSPCVRVRYCRDACASCGKVTILSVRFQRKPIWLYTDLESYPPPIYVRFNQLLSTCYVRM